MNKKIKIGISILLLIMISVHVSYAISNQTEKGFFKVNKEEVSKEETLEMTFEISSLKYNKFKILLKSNVDSEDIYTENGENVSIDNDKNAISIDVDKEKIGLNQIKLYYPIPKEMAIGTKIQFTAQIIVTDEIKEKNPITNTTRDNTVTNELEINNTTQNSANKIKQDNTTKSSENKVEQDNTTQNSENKIKQNNTTQSLENKVEQDNTTQNSENEIKQDNTKEEIVAEEITKTITVVEKKIEDDKNSKNTTQSEEKNENNNEQNNESKMPNIEKNSSSQEQNNNQNEKMSSSSASIQKMSSNANIGSSLSNSGVNNENQATYNGSNNNYLSKIEVEGMELNTSFHKENETYFINVNNTNTINVVLAAEDSKAKINITGNDTIQNGNNKILISVTAENGDVRYYRIFVNCEEEKDET